MADPKLGLTVFLIKPDQLPDFDKVVTKAVAAVSLAAPLDGVFVPFPTAPRTPPWVEAVRGLLQRADGLRLTSQSPAGILVLRHAGHTFAVTFGHAWQRLEDKWLEAEFGRRVALNAIKPDGVVEIRAEQVFAKWHLASERAPRASAVREFGVDFDRDLVAAVEGVSSDPLLGSTVRGGTSLRASLPISQLVPLCDRAQTLFKSDAYKKRWPEIDNLTPVRSDSTIGALEDRLDEDLRDGAAFPSLVLFTPSQRREQAIYAESYVFGRMSAQPAMSPYLTVDAWLNHLKRNGSVASVAKAKATKIHMLDGDNSPSQTTSAFECFGYELALNENSTYSRPASGTRWCLASSSASTRPFAKYRLRT